MRCWHFSISTDFSWASLVQGKYLSIISPVCSWAEQQLSNSVELETSKITVSMYYQGMRLGFQLPSVAGSHKRISKAVLWDTTKDLLTGVIGALRTTKEIWSSKGLSPPLNRKALGITNAYVLVLMKYLGRHINNYNIDYLAMFPPGPVLKKKFEKLRNYFVYSHPSSPLCPSPTSLKLHLFPQERRGQGEGNLWRRGSSVGFQAQRRDPVLTASSTAPWRMKLTADSLCSTWGNRDSLPHCPSTKQSILVTWGACAS